MTGVTVRVLPYGPTARLFEVADVASAAGLAARLRAARLDGVAEIVPAARTVLVMCRDPATVERLESLVGAYAPAPPRAGELVEIPVVYDGEDLSSIAEVCGLTADELVEAHAAPIYRAAFCGFSPGFTYLTGLDPRLHRARRSTPRPRVEAGTVAIAAEFTAVYPRDSPGGWHALGHTSAPMWDTARNKPALVAPGDRVRFVPVGR
jgi:KipI family sensor histidine kinase inhibitor